MNGSTRSNRSFFTVLTTGTLRPCMSFSHWSDGSMVMIGPLMNADLNVVRSSTNSSRASKKPPSTSTSSSSVSHIFASDRACAMTWFSAHSFPSRMSCWTTETGMSCPSISAFVMSFVMPKSICSRISLGMSGLGDGVMVHGFSAPDPTSTSLNSALACRALVANSIM